MIQEPAANVQEEVSTSLYVNGNVNVNPIGGINSMPNCNCSQKRITQTSSTTTTTIPIVLNTQPNPRIILIKVPNRAEQRAPRTRLIRIPFLPGPVPTKSSRKQAPPTINSIVNPISTATASPIITGMTRHPIESKQSSLNNCYMDDQIAKDQILGLPTMVQHMNQSTVQVSAPTLASMAGIQLTGADVQVHQDMSGAMPTATVEEIDVPVFIDEYLQDIEGSSSTGSSSNSNKSVNGPDNCSKTTDTTETTTFDFDFDINLIADDRTEEMDFFSSSSFSISNNNTNINNNSNNIYDDIDNVFNTTTNDLPAEWEEEIQDMSKYGIAFEEPNKDSNLTAFMMSSQDPIFGTSYSQPNSQTICFNEEPRLAPDNDNCDSYNPLLFGVDLGDDIKPVVNTLPIGTIVDMGNGGGGSCVGVKRSAATAALSIISSTTPKEKRSKLSLVIKPEYEVHNTEAINTPQVISNILDLEMPNVKALSTSQDTIFEELCKAEDTTANTFDFSEPNTPYSSYSTSSYSGNTNIQTAPASPSFSTTSVSQFSTTTSTTNGGSKRKRGRPAKDHSDGPDPDLMSRMTDDEVKAYQDRLKNNEASRVSRRKTKQREEDEKKEDEILIEENQRLQSQLNEVRRQTKKLKNVLAKRFQQNSRYTEGRAF